MLTVLDDMIVTYDVLDRRNPEKPFLCARDVLKSLSNSRDHSEL
jgi:hypothetical protein